MAENPLSERDRKFVEMYLATGGNGTAAAQFAGRGKETHSQEALASRLIRQPHIQAAIQERVSDDPLVATRQERQRWWTAIMRDGEMEIGARLRASELLAKSQGDFVVKVEAKVTQIDPHTELTDKINAIAERTKKSATLNTSH